SRSPRHRPRRRPGGRPGGARQMPCRGPCRGCRRPGEWPPAVRRPAVRSTAVADSWGFLAGGWIVGCGTEPGGRFEPSHGGAPAPLSISPRRGHRRRPAPIPSDNQGICGPGRQSLYTRPTTINNNSTTKEYLPMSRLANKVAVVAGGATGIGAACAIRYAAEGAKVVIGDFNIDTARELAESIGPNAIAVRYDAADADSIKALIDSAVETFGTLNVLHNNVAITSLAIQSQDTTVVDIPLEIWNATLNINVTSFLLGSKYAIPHMIAAGGGSIINTSSDSGRVGDVVRTAYGASKAAVISLTQHIAVQYGLQGVRCNAITPGVILTGAMK